MKDSKDNWSYEQLAGHTNAHAVRYTMAVFVAVYVAAIAVAESTTALLGVVPGALLHAFLVPALLLSYVLMGDFPYRRVFPVLALAPLLRLLTLMMVVRQAPPVYWYAISSTPLLLGIWICARLLNLSWQELGLRRTAWGLQVAIAFSGIPTGLIGLYLLHPRSVMVNFGWFQLVIGALVLLLFTAFMEEVIFRGLLLNVVDELFGRGGILCGVALYGVMSLGTRSVSYLVYVGLVNLFFGWCAKHTGSIWGVTLAHGLLNIGMLIVWPWLLTTRGLPLHFG